MADQYTQEYPPPRGSMGLMGKLGELGPKGERGSPWWLQVPKSDLSSLFRIPVDEQTEVTMIDVRQKMGYIICRGAAHEIRRLDRGDDMRVWRLTNPPSPSLDQDVIPDGFYSFDSPVDGKRRTFALFFQTTGNEVPFAQALDSFTKCKQTLEAIQHALIVQYDTFFGENTVTKTIKNDFKSTAPKVFIRTWQRPIDDGRVFSIRMLEGYPVWVIPGVADRWTMDENRLLGHFKIRTSGTEGEQIYHLLKGCVQPYNTYDLEDFDIKIPGALDMDAKTWLVEEAVARIAGKICLPTARTVVPWSERWARIRRKFKVS